KYNDGIIIRVNRLENRSPAIIVIAKGSNKGSPEKATGINATIDVTEVNRIDLIRAYPELTIASMIYIDSVNRRASTKSINTTAFLTTIPVKETIPITPRKLSGVCVINKPSMAPEIQR